MINMDSQFIVFNTKTELLRLDVSKIVYFEGDGNYTQIVTINKLKAVVCLNLSQMEKYLAEHLVDCKSILCEWVSALSSTQAISIRLIRKSNN